MACLTIRDLPERTLGELRKRAGINHRSLNGEILYIIDRVVDGIDEYAAIRENRAARQRAALRKIAGQWEDGRDTAAIIADIEGTRTKGREVRFDIA